MYIFQINSLSVASLAVIFSHSVAAMRSRKKLTQKDNADSGVQFITPAGPRQSLLLAKDPDQHL